MFKNKTTLYGMLAVTVIVLFLWWKRSQWLNSNSTPDDVMDMGANSLFTNPYWYTNPGIPDMPQILNGSTSPFNSVINVGVNVDAYSGLSNDYMPMFGMVGVTGFGQM